MMRRRTSGMPVPTYVSAPAVLHPAYVESRAALENRYVATLGIAKQVAEDDVALTVQAVAAALSQRSLVATVRDGSEEGLDHVIRVVLGLDVSGSVLAAGTDGRLTSVQPIDQMIRGLAHLWQRPIGLDGADVEWPTSRAVERTDESFERAFGTGMLGTAWWWWRRDAVARGILHGMATGSGRPVSYGLTRDRVIASIETDEVVIATVDGAEQLPSGIVAVTGETLWLQVQQLGWPGPLTFSIESDPIAVLAAADPLSEAARLARALAGIDLFHGLGNPGTTVDGEQFNALVEILISGERMPRDERFRAIGDIFDVPVALVEAAIRREASFETVVAQLADETGSRTHRVRRIDPSSGVRAAQVVTLYEWLTLPTEGEGALENLQRWFVAGPLRQIVLGAAALALGAVLLGHAFGFFDVLGGQRRNLLPFIALGVPFAVVGAVNVAAGLIRIVRWVRRGASGGRELSEPAAPPD